MKFLTSALLSVLYSAAIAAVPPQMHAFIEKWCIDCHDKETHKGGLSLDGLDFGGDEDTHARWVRVFDKVLAGEMPPAKKPRADETVKFAPDFLYLREGGATGMSPLLDDYALATRLAGHYRIEGVTGPAIRKVKLPPGTRRGGFFMQGAVLKVSTNGTNTSPSMRRTTRHLRISSSRSRSAWASTHPHSAAARRRACRASTPCDAHSPAPPTREPASEPA